MPWESDWCLWRVLSKGQFDLRVETSTLAAVVRVACGKETEMKQGTGGESTGVIQVGGMVAQSH